MNRWYKMAFAVTTAIMAFPSCGTAQHVITDIEETFQGIDEVVVIGGFLDVSYEGSDKEELFLSAYLESNQKDGQEIIYKVEGNRLRVEFKRQGSVGWRNVRSKGFISLIGPEEMEMEITTSSGKMFISNVASDKIDLRASSGKIEARNLSSDKIELTASSGRMDIENINGNVECKASSGGGRITKVQGDVSVVASSGSYEISEVEGKVDGSLSSGSISLDRVAELGNLAVSSGRIKAAKAGLGERTRLSGSSGSFTIQTDDDLTDFNYDLSASSGSLEVGTTKTGKKLNIDNGSNKTVSGSISSGRISIQN
jgi:lia operon protein LiaG